MQFRGTRMSFYLIFTGALINLEREAMSSLNYMPLTGRLI